MFCPKCGTENADQVQFCTKCGEQINQPPVENAQQAPEGNNAPPPVYNPVPASTSGNNMPFTVLCYLGILWLIGMLVEPQKNDPDVKFHVGQGIILTIFEVGGYTILSILSVIFRYIPFGGIFLIIVGLLYLALSVICVVCMIMGIINAVQNNKKELPIIGQFASKLTFLK